MRARSDRGRRVQNGQVDGPQPPETKQFGLGNLVLDKDLIDARGRRAGKVDDIVLDLVGSGPDGIIPPPAVTAIETGPFGFAQHLPALLQALVRGVYRLLGVDDPRPVLIPWDDIVGIDVVVHVCVDRERAGLLKLQKAVERRIIGHLPGACAGYGED